MSRKSTTIFDMWDFSSAFFNKYLKINNINLLSIALLY